MRGGSVLAVTAMMLLVAVGPVKAEEGPAPDELQSEGSPPSPEQGESTPVLECAVRQMVVARVHEVLYDGTTCLRDDQVLAMADDTTSQTWIAGADPGNTCGILVWARVSVEFVAVPCAPKGLYVKGSALDQACAELPMSVPSFLVLCRDPAMVAAAPNYGQILTTLASLLGVAVPELPGLPGLGALPDIETPEVPSPDLPGLRDLPDPNLPGLGDVPDPNLPGLGDLPDTPNLQFLMLLVAGLLAEGGEAADNVVAIIENANPCGELAQRAQVCGFEVPDAVALVQNLLALILGRVADLQNQLEDLNPCGDVTQRAEVCGVDVDAIIADLTDLAEAVVALVLAANPCKDVTAQSRAQTELCGVILPDTDEIVQEALATVNEVVALLLASNPCKDVIGPEIQAAEPRTICGVPVPDVNEIVADALATVDQVLDMVLAMNPCGDVTGEIQLAGLTTVCGIDVPPCASLPDGGGALGCGGSAPPCDGILLTAPAFMAVCVPDPCDHVNSGGLPVSGCGGSDPQCDGTSVTAPDLMTVCVPDHCDRLTGPISCESGCDGLAQAAGPLGTYACVADPCDNVNSNLPLPVCQGDCEGEQPLALPDGSPVCIPNECDYLLSPAREMLCAESNKDCDGTAVNVGDRVICVPDHCTYVPQGPAYELTCGCDGSVDTTTAAGFCTDPCDYYEVLLSPLLPGGPCPPSTDPCDSYSIVMMLLQGPDPNPFGCPPPTDYCAYYNYAGGQANLPQGQDAPPCPLPTDPCYYYHFGMGMVPHPSGGPLPCPPPTEPCAYHAYASSFADAQIPGIDPSCPPDPCYTYAFAANTVPGGWLYYEDGGAVGASLYGKTVGDCVPDPIDVLCYYYAKAMATVGSLAQVTSTSTSQDRAAVVDVIPACIPDQCTTTIAPYWQAVFTSKPCKVPDPCASWALGSVQNAFDAQCMKKPTELVPCLALCVTYTLNGEAKTMPPGVPAVFLANEREIRETTAAAASAVNCQYDIVDNMPVVHPCPSEATGLANQLPSNVKAVVYLVGGKTPAAFAGTFLVVPNPLYGGVLDASATVDGSTVGIQIGSQAEFAMLTGELVDLGSTADADLTFVAPRASGSAAVYVSTSSLPTSYLVQGSPTSGTGAPAYWTANLHYESTPLQSLTLNWDSSVVAPLTASLGSSAAVTINNMPLSVQGAKAEFLSDQDVGHFRIQWPGTENIDSILVTLGQTVLEIYNPPTVFDVSVDTAVQDQSGTAYRVVDFLLAGQRTGTGRFDVVANLAGTTITALGLSDNLQAHVEFQDGAFNSLGLLTAGTEKMPGFRASISDHKNPAGNIAQSISISVPGKANVQIERINAVELDTLAGSYKLSLGQGGLILAQFSGETSGLVEIKAPDGIELFGTMATTKDGAVTSLKADLTASGGTGSWEFLLMADGDIKAHIMRVVSLTIDSSSGACDSTDYAKIKATFENGLVYLPVPGTCDEPFVIDIVGIEHLGITYDRSNGLENFELDNIKLAWRMSADGHIKLTGKGVSIVPGTGEVVDCEVTFPFSCGTKTVHGDVVNIKNDFVEALCGAPISDIIMDRNGEHRSLCFGNVILETLGTNPDTAGDAVRDLYQLGLDLDYVRQGLE